MLVAYGPNEQPVVAEEVPLAKLQGWSRERLLLCPNCRNIVHVRGGPDKRTQLHFSHQRGECEWGTESESVRHARGKLVLAHWLRVRYPDAVVTLEERLPEPNRIADIFVQHPTGVRQAIEFQCAPLEVGQWYKRHEAYQKAGIVDTWIVGVNRSGKQEAFIEAIVNAAHAILFLDPLISPARSWLRWSVSRQQALLWQNDQPAFAGLPADASQPLLDGWVGKRGFGMTIASLLEDLHLDEQGRLIHPTRALIETHTELLQTMSTARVLDEQHLRIYLKGHALDETALLTIILPLLRSYRLDPELLRRYNYGRGLHNKPPAEADQQRINKACSWLSSLAQQHISPADLKKLFQTLPRIGPYAAFANYAEMLLTLTIYSHTNP